MSKPIEQGCGIGSIRLLKASEIEVRVQQVTARNGAVLLLYKNARCDMSILDETFGMFGWQREHSFKDGKNYCRVSIMNPGTGDWIVKEDVGTESNTEAEKGQASDAFKRACTNVGIGRELYTSPFIFVNLKADEVVTGSGKPRLASGVRFEVSRIDYQERAIALLEIVDGNGNVRYRYPRNSRAEAPATQHPAPASQRPAAAQSSQAPAPTAGTPSGRPVPSGTTKTVKPLLTAEDFKKKPELLSKLLLRTFGKYQEAGSPQSFDAGFFLSQFYMLDAQTIELFNVEFEKLKYASGNGQ